MKTYLIVPAVTAQGGQCRIVARDGEHRNALRQYRAFPSQWREVGLMNSRGQLVCLDAPACVVADMKSMEPLMAGMQVGYII